MKTQDEPILKLEDAAIAAAARELRHQAHVYANMESRGAAADALYRAALTYAGCVLVQRGGAL